jgi:hypothetical protein
MQALPPHVRQGAAAPVQQQTQQQQQRQHTQPGLDAPGCHVCVHLCIKASCMHTG